MLAPKNKNRGQVILETVIVVIVLAVVAIGTIALFSNLNTQMLDRLNIFRQTRLQSLNNPSLLKTAYVAPASLKGKRSLSNPTTFLDYLPKGGVSIIPYVPSGAFSWEDFETDNPTSYELQLIMGLALRYKLNQVNWLAQKIGLQNKGMGYIYLPNAQYVYSSKTLLSRSQTLLSRAKTLILALLLEYETDPLMIQQSTAGINDAFTAARTELNRISSGIGNVARDKYTKLYYLTGPPINPPTHYYAVNLTKMIVGQEAYKVDIYAYNNETGELLQPPTLIQANGTNPLEAVYDQAGGCDECFSGMVNDPFFNTNVMDALRNTWGVAGGDMTMAACRTMVNQLDKVKGAVTSDPNLEKSFFLKIFLRLYDRLKFLLNPEYYTRTNWNDESAKNLRALARLEAKYLYYSVEQARP